MAVMTSPADAVRPFTVTDLEGMPDDGRQYELIDGELLVSPAPGWSHQEAALTLYRLLHAACPRELRVLAAPFAVRPDPFNELQPDVLVARYDSLTERCLPGAPLLAVEVISPTSRLRDTSLKKAAYARLGVPSFWLVDPDMERPSLTVFELAEPELAGSELTESELAGSELAGSELAGAEPPTVAGAATQADPGPGVKASAELPAEAEYRTVARVAGSEPFAAVQPFPVRVTPAELVAGLHPR
jgi:Uma2 family endonuclease